MKYVIALAAALVLNAAANLMMKIGTQPLKGGLMAGGPVGAVLTVLKSPILLAGLICFGLNAFFYMFALQSRTLKISLAYPIMTSGGFAIIAVVASLAPSLRERLSLGQWAGVALVLGGVMLIAALTPGSDVAELPG